MAAVSVSVPDGRRGLKLDSARVLSVAAIGSLPFVLLLINNNWLFSRPIGIDRWIYTGFHLHLPELLRTYGNTYYASRLPWTVLGWLLHSAFDDATALYILHFAVFYLAAFSLYAAVRTIFANTMAAASAALLLGTHVYFLVSVGWDYVDGAAIACMLAGLAALSSAAIRPRWRLASVAWGVAVCAMVSMYILLVVLVIVQIGLFLLLNRARARRPVLIVMGLFVAGGIGTALCFGVINWLLGGPFFYIFNQIAILFAVANNRFRYDEPLVQWARHSPWLFVTAVSFAFSCGYVALRCAAIFSKLNAGSAADDRETSLFICCLGNLAACLIFIALQVDHFYVLQMFENAGALIPYDYLVIGGACAVIIKSSGQTRQLAFLGGVAAITLLPWLLGTFEYSFFPMPILFTGLALQAGWIAAGSLLLLFVVQRARGAAGAVLVISLLSFINLNFPQTSFANEARPSIFRNLIGFPPNPIYEQDMLAICDASRAVGFYNPQARARFWFDAKDPQVHLLRDVASSYLYEYNLVNENFPNLVDKDGRPVSVVPGQRIILLSSRRDNLVASANAAVAGKALLFDEVAKIEIHRPGVAFAIVVTDVKIDPSKYEKIAPSVFDRPAISGTALKLADTPPFKFRTPAQPWAYGAQFPLRIHDLKGPLWIRIQADVIGGPAGFGVLNKRGNGFLTRIPVSAAKDGTVDLLVSKPDEIGDLVVQTWDNGVPVEVAIGQIAVYKRRED